MAASTEHVTCINYSFSLGDSTTVLDMRKVMRDNPLAAEQAKPKAPRASASKLKGPDAVGKGSSNFTSIIQQLEARYAGAQAIAEHGYDRDGFVVSDDEDSTVLDESTEIHAEDFFVTDQPTERRKRQHTEVTPGEVDLNNGEAARKKKKLQEDMSGLHSEVQKALLAFGETWNAFSNGRSFPRFPPEMDSAIATVGQVAMAHHPKGHLSNEIVEIVQEITGFSAPTLKPRLRKAASAGEGGAGPTSSGAAATSASPTHAEAISFLQQSGPEYVTALELSDTSARNSGLQILLEKNIEGLGSIVREFTDSFAEPPKRSPWNEAIRAKLRLVFAINDSIVPPPVTASTLRSHVLQLWPSSWDVKDTQIKPLTRYTTPKPKAVEAPNQL